MSDGIEHQSWRVSAPFYHLSYIDIAHHLDEALFAYLADKVQGAVVADCGCGPGVVVEKFLQRGASRVIGVDLNKAMLQQTRERVSRAVDKGQVQTVQAAFEPSLFPHLQKQYLDGQGFDVILFKRSLYMGRAQALSVLRAAANGLNDDGILAVIHGKRSLKYYAFGPGMRPMPYTPYHLFNRTISKLGEWFGIGNYKLYTEKGLLDLLCEAAPKYQVEKIPSEQHAYNLGAIRAEHSQT
ncbi:MAG: class I SAM-dependent methyltransferase [Anaerolineae bacterium]